LDLSHLKVKGLSANSVKGQISLPPFCVFAPFICRFTTYSSSTRFEKMVGQLSYQSLARGQLSHSGSQSYNTGNQVDGNTNLSY